MCLTIDDLCSRSRDRRTSHAARARSDQTRVGPVWATLFGAGLVPCPGLAPGCAARAWGPHRHHRLTGEGPRGGALLHERSSGPAPGRLVGPPGESDAVGPV